MNTSNQSRLMPRREFLAQTGRGVIGLTTAGWLAQTGVLHAAPPAASSRRIGAVAYNYAYSLGLFNYRNRPGERMDNLGFIEAVHQAGGNVAQLYGPSLGMPDEAGLKRLRTRAEELDVSLEVQGGPAQDAGYVKIMEQTAALGSKVVGCTFGYQMRPDKIKTLKAWDEHMRMCEARLRELALHAKRLRLTIGVEPHADFALEELHGLMKKIDSPQVGVLFDIGFGLFTLDDPVAAAELLGPFTVATHYKDFAVEETPLGFRVTMVALGCGSLDLPAITAALLKKLRPEVNIAIEMINGQQLDVKWLKPGFWTAFRNKSADEVSATLNHIRRQTVNRAEVRSFADINAMSHEEHLQFEARQSQRCIGYLQKLVAS